MIFIIGYTYLSILMLYEFFSLAKHIKFDPFSGKTSNQNIYCKIILVSNWTSLGLQLNLDMKRPLKNVTKMIHKAPAIVPWHSICCMRVEQVSYIHYLYIEMYWLNKNVSALMHVISLQLNVYAGMSPAPDIAVIIIFREICMIRNYVHFPQTVSHGQRWTKWRFN